MSKNELFELDSIDLQLLDALQTDAAQSNQALAEQLQLSPPTCLRRTKRLHRAGLIERQVAILQPDRSAALLGHGLQAIVEITLSSTYKVRCHKIRPSGIQRLWRLTT